VLSTQDQEPVDNESAPRIGVDAWRAAGYTGKGVKIGVLDFGYDGYKDLLGTILPPSLLMRSFVLGEEVDQTGIKHGAAVVEIIHAIAPDVQIVGAGDELFGKPGIGRGAKWPG
jgi:hypothetical protein